MIKLIVLGKIKEDYLNKLIADYQKRISKYHKITIIELKDQNNLEKEASDIKRHIGANDYVIALELKGEKYDSFKFAQLIEKTFITNSTITFIVGSSEGLDQSIINLSNARISFSDLTFPHGLFRGILLEQIYRALKINNHETYHK